MNEQFAFEVSADVYRMQRRPNGTDIIVNDGYRGLRAIDPWNGEDTARVPFPAELGDSSVISGWAFRADGELVVVFNDEARRGCVVSLAEGTSRAIAHPPWSVTTGMPYDWRGDTLWMKDPDAFAFATLDTEVGLIVEDDGNRALQMNRQWRRALDRMRRAGAVSVRVEPELAQALVVADAETPRVGRIGWVDQAEIMVPARPGVVQLASLGENLVLLYEYELVVLDRQGDTTMRTSAPAGFHYLDVEGLPASNGKPAAVVTAASALDGRGTTRFSVVVP